MTMIKLVILAFCLVAVYTQPELCEEIKTEAAASKQGDVQVVHPTDEKTNSPTKAAEPPVEDQANEKSVECTCAKLSTDKQAIDSAASASTPISASDKKHKTINVSVPVDENAESPAEMSVTPETPHESLDSKKNGQKSKEREVKEAKVLSEGDAEDEVDAEVPKDDKEAIQKPSKSKSKVDYEKSKDSSYKGKQDKKSRSKRDAKGKSKRKGSTKGRESSDKKNKNKSRK